MSDKGIELCKTSTCAYLETWIQIEDTKLKLQFPEGIELIEVLWKNNQWVLDYVRVLWMNDQWVFDDVWWFLKEP